MNDDAIDQSVLADLHKLGGETFVQQMLDVFLDYAPTRIAAARLAESEGSLDALAMAVHPLKSGANNVGALPLRDIASKIERDARKGESSRISSNLALLENEFARAVARIAEWRILQPARTMQTEGGSP